MACNLLLLALASSALAQFETEINFEKTLRKPIPLPKQTVQMEVFRENKEHLMDAVPYLDYREIKGRTIDTCEIVQGSFSEGPGGGFTDAKYFPVALDKRYYQWLRYADAEFLLFRDSEDTPIKCARFSRAGLQIDFWNIDEKIIENKLAKDIKIVKDLTEENGPSPTRNAATYLFVAPRHLIYHEINYLGRTVKVKNYQLDNDIVLQDMIVISKKVYLVTPTAMITLAVNEDKMMKEGEILIPPNTIQKVAATSGQIFLFTRMASDGHTMVVSANNKFINYDDYIHLTGRKIDLIKAGNRSYLVFIIDDPNDIIHNLGTYYWIKNPGAKKASSLVFEKIPEMREKVDHVFELSDRIHFIKGSKHWMYTKGSKKQLVMYKNPLKNPILGLVYWSTFQKLEEDKLLLVQDVLNQGVIKVAPLVFNPPKVICAARENKYERYEKFTVYTSKKEYDYEIVFHTTGSGDFVSGSLFEIVFACCLAISLMALSYLCMKRSINDRDFRRLNAALKEKNPDYDPNSLAKTDPQAEGEIRAKPTVNVYSDESYGDDEDDLEVAM